MSTVARLSVEEYDRIIATGVFDHPVRRRVELVRGEIRDMNPIGPLHEDAVDLLAEWSFDSVPRMKVRVRVQNSIGLPELDTVPEPDLAWVRRRAYSRGRPTPRDVLLVIEVADTSLAYDTGEKADLYAAASIGDSPQAPEAAKVEDPAPIRPESTSRAVPPAGPHACSAAGPIRPGHRQHRRASSPSRDEAPCSRFRET